MNVYETPKSGRGMLSQTALISSILVALTVIFTPLTPISNVTSPLGLRGATSVLLQGANETLIWYDRAFNEDGENALVLQRSRYIESIAMEEFYYSGNRDLDELFSLLKPTMEVKARLKNVPASEALCDNVLMAQLASRLGELDDGERYFRRYEKLERRVERQKRQLDRSCVDKMEALREKAGMDGGQ